MRQGAMLAEQQGPFSRALPDSPLESRSRPERRRADGLFKSLLQVLGQRKNRLSF